MVTHQVNHFIISVCDQSNDLPWLSLHDLVGVGLKAEVLIVENLPQYGLTRSVQHESIAFTLSTENEDLVTADTDGYRLRAWSEYLLICDDQQLPADTAALSSHDSLCIQPLNAV